MGRQAEFKGTEVSGRRPPHPPAGLKPAPASTLRRLSCIMGEITRRSTGGAVSHTPQRGRGYVPAERSEPPPHPPTLLRTRRERATPPPRGPAGADTRHDHVRRQASTLA